MHFIVKPFTKQELAQASEIRNSTLLKNMCTLSANRLNCLVDFLAKQGIAHKIITLKEKKYCIVRFNDKYYTEAGTTKTLIAHYDKMPNTFGANDNAAACALLAFFAMVLNTSSLKHNTQIIFTDSEELDNKSITEQGSFLLGLALRKLLTKKDQVFVFDVCGKGDTLVLSESGLFSRKTSNNAQLERLEALHANSKLLARACSIPYTSLPTAYSDNAGLLATGIIAQLITILPSDEVLQYEKALKDLESRLPKETFQNEVTKCVIEKSKYCSPFLKKGLPKTWDELHTTKDSLENLDTISFATVNRFLKGILNTL